MSSSNINNTSLPLAIFLYPKETDTAFDSNSSDFIRRKKTMGNNYRVHVLKPDTIEDAYTQVKQIVEKSKNKFKYLEFAGHGNAGELVWDKSVNEGGNISVGMNKKLKKKFRELLELADKDCVFVTQSCKNGAKNGNELNLLQFIAGFIGKGQHVVGSATSKFSFKIENLSPLHFQYIDNETNENVTKVWYRSIDGGVNSICIDEFNRLWSLFEREPEVINLFYQLLGERTNIGKFIEIRKSIQNKQCAKKADNPLIKEFQNTTLRKEEGTQWTNLLNDLEKLAQKLGRSSSERKIEVTPSMRSDKVKETKTGLTIPMPKPIDQYEKIYRFILGLAAIDKNKYLISLFDNNKKYADNPAARMLYALTGQVQHSENNSLTSLILGMNNIQNLVMDSYKLAKKMTFFKIG